MNPGKIPSKLSPSPSEPPKEPEKTGKWAWLDAIIQRCFKTRLSPSKPINTAAVIPPPRKSIFTRLLNCLPSRLVGRTPTQPAVDENPRQMKSFEKYFTVLIVKDTSQTNEKIPYVAEKDIEKVLNQNTTDTQECITIPCVAGPPNSVVAEVWAKVWDIEAFMEPTSLGQKSNPISLAELSLLKKEFKEIQSLWKNTSQQVDSNTESRIDELNQRLKDLESRYLQALVNHMVESSQSWIPNGNSKEVWQERLEQINELLSHYSRFSMDPNKNRLKNLKTICNEALEKVWQSGEPQFVTELKRAIHKCDHAALQRTCESDHKAKLQVNYTDKNGKTQFSVDSTKSKIDDVKTAVAEQCKTPLGKAAMIGWSADIRNTVRNLIEEIHSSFQVKGQIPQELTIEESVTITATKDGELKIEVKLTWGMNEDDQKGSRLQTTCSFFLTPGATIQTFPTVRDVTVEDKILQFPTACKTEQEKDAWSKKINGD